MNWLDKIIGDIEGHDVDGIKQCFENGVSPNVLFRNEPLIYELTSEYARGPRFKDCVKVFIDHGLKFEDKALLSVLADDATQLRQLIIDDKQLVTKRYSLRCAYTPLHQATLLHICAEFNHVACADVLFKHGADVNAAAGFDEFRFGGQTPIFHTVNQNSNASAEMMHLLLEKNADLKITLPGLIWGKAWETFIPAVNPINYAMMGLLPQMHRNERTISETVSLLLKRAYGISYISPNVPNKYLNTQNL
jgi:ankyrin repeat protein